MPCQCYPVEPQHVLPSAITLLSPCGRAMVACVRHCGETAGDWTPECRMYHVRLSIEAPRGVRTGARSISLGDLRLMGERGLPMRLDSSATDDAPSRIGRLGR